MFDRLSKSGAITGGGPTPSRLGDLSGAFADLGTFLPLVIGLLVLDHVDPMGLLIGFGLFAIATRLIYRLPIPAQPMKLVAALAIAGGLSAAAMMASGLLLGVALLILGTTGLIDRMHRLVPRTVLAGLQLALGLHLLITSVALTEDAPGQALLALGLFILVLMTKARPLACLLLVLIGALWSLGVGDSTLSASDLSWHMPALGMLPWCGRPCSTVSSRYHVWPVYGPRPIATGWLDENDGHNC